MLWYKNQKQQGVVTFFGLNHLYKTRATLRSFRDVPVRSSRNRISHHSMELMAEPIRICDIQWHFLNPRDIVLRVR